jgi:protein arginine N-methyltransferase 1
MYSVAAYGKMIADRVRVAAYSEALRRAIKPGCTVLDIGTGTGFFAMLACRLGARKVYAVEPDDVIELARIAARSNGYDDRIVFIKDLSTRVELPELVDVVVSDLRTVLPWFQHHITTIVDARERLLKPGGALIPEQDRLWAAVVEMPEFYAQHVAHQPQDTAGFDMSAARHVGTSAWAKARAQPEQLLTEPRQWAVLDYHRVTDTHVDAQIDWTSVRAGTAHGLVAWFDTDLADGIGFSNAPSVEPALYGNAFFPWEEPVDLATGDEISVTLRANLVADEYIWRWKSRVTVPEHAGKIKAEFTQVNLTGPLMMNDTLRLSASSYTPARNDRAEVDRFILDQMNGKSSSREIAEAVALRFPSMFQSWELALQPVAELALRYCR